MRRPSPHTHPRRSRLPTSLRRASGTMESPSTPPSSPSSTPSPQTPLQAARRNRTPSQPRTPALPSDPPFMSHPTHLPCIHQGSGVPQTGALVLPQAQKLLVPGPPFDESDSACSTVRLAPSSPASGGNSNLRQCEPFLAPFVSAGASCIAPEPLCTKFYLLPASPFPAISPSRGNEGVHFASHVLGALLGWVFNPVDFLAISV